VSAKWFYVLLNEEADWILLHFTPSKKVKHLSECVTWSITVTFTHAENEALWTVRLLNTNKEEVVIKSSVSTLNARYFVIFATYVG